MPAERAPPAWRRALAWTAPSAVTAVLAALLAGLVEGARTAASAPELAATAAFGAVVAVPVLLVAAVIVRGLWAAWRPRRLAAALIDERGAAPRVAAWAIYVAIATGFLAWATGNGVRWLAIISSFKPVVVQLALPVMVALAGLAVAALSRPLVDLIAAGLERWERRRAARGRRAIVTPRITVTALVGGAALVLAALWWIWIHPRVGHLDLIILVHPLVAIAAAAAGHAVWRRRPGVRAAAAITAAVAMVAIAAGSAATRMAAPALALDVWSRPTIAGLAVDQLFDLDAIRSAMAPTAFRPVARTAVHPDVVLITIDTVRADRTPLAHGPVRMPALEALGARGAVFDWAFSPGNVTRRSIPSIVLGLAPTRVHGRVEGWALKLDPRHVLLAERFRAAGYDTAGFVCCDSFWQPTYKLGINRGLDHLYITRDGGPLSAAARTWLEARDAAGPKRPLFLWVHFLDPHNWNGDNSDTHIDDAKRKRYEDVLAQTDRYLGELLRAFASRPPGREPILVVTADHGEGLGDHDAPYHSQDLYDSQTHVPLVVVGPGVAARHVAQPVQLVDLAPTLLDLAGFVPPGMPDMDGTPITDLVTGARPGDADGGYAFMAQVADRSVSDDQRAIVVGRWKIIDLGGDRFELYDLRVDPGELHDLAAANPAQLARMKALLAARAAIDDVSPFR